NDNNSKDQLIGYVFALGAFWDAIAEDSSIPQTVRDQLQTDARQLATSLMTPVTLGLSGSADLIVRDWHDCPTKHLDLNPRVVPVDGWDPLILGGTSTNQNGWNALAALGVMRTLYHITGDAAVGRYYYTELVTNRNFPLLAVSGPARVRAMYQDSGNIDTNFSNVNMACCATSRTPSSVRSTRACSRRSCGTSGIRTTASRSTNRSSISFGLRSARAATMRRPP